MTRQPPWIRLTRFARLGAWAAALAFAAPVRGDDATDAGDAATTREASAEELARRRDDNPDRAPVTRAARFAADGDFEGVDGWGPLHWNMAPEEALRALERVGIEAELGETLTGMFDSPSCPPEQPDCGAVHSFVEQDFTDVAFEYHGWLARAEFAGWQLRAVSLAAPQDPEAGREARMLEDLERLYGAPSTTFPPETYGGFRRTVWSNSATELTLLAGRFEGLWSTSLRYERIPRGWP